MVWTLSAIVPSENKDINNWHFYYFCDRASLKKRQKKKNKTKRDETNQFLQNIIENVFSWNLLLTK